MKLQKIIIMKTKLYIFLILISLSHFAFGQRGDSHNFNFKVKFDKNIPVDSLQIFYIEQESRLNAINTISYETNKKNEIILKGENYSIAAAGNYFPIIIFSLKENKFSKNSNEKIETYRLFYLISEIETYLKGDIDKEIFFQNSNYPYFIRVDFIWENEKRVYNIEQVPLEQLSTEILEIVTSNNNLIKINKKK